MTIDYDHDSIYGKNGLVAFRWVVSCIIKAVKLNYSLPAVMVKVISHGHKVSRFYAYLICSSAYSLTNFTVVEPLSLLMRAM